MKLIVPSSCVKVESEWSPTSTPPRVPSWCRKRKLYILVFSTKCRWLITSRDSEQERYYGRWISDTLLHHIQPGFVPDSLRPSNSKSKIICCRIHTFITIKLICFIISFFLVTNCQVTEV